MCNCVLFYPFIYATRGGGCVSTIVGGGDNLGGQTSQSSTFNWLRLARQLQSFLALISHLKTIRFFILLMPILFHLGQTRHAIPGEALRIHYQHVVTGRSTTYYPSRGRGEFLLAFLIYSLSFYHTMSSSLLCDLFMLQIIWLNRKVALWKWLAMLIEKWGHPWVSLGCLPSVLGSPHKRFSLGLSRGQRFLDPRLHSRYGGTQSFLFGTRSRSVAISYA